MPRPLRSLSMVQNWDCRGCADCCRTYAVRVTEAERAAIESQDWSDVPDLQDVPHMIWDRRLGGHRLNHRADGSCVFLGPDNRCRIHAKYGAAAKPTACRIYPFTFAPAGDHWRVGLRYSCPSAAANHGRPLAEHAAELKDFAAMLEADKPAFGQSPTMRSGQTLPWPDLLRIATKLAELLGDVARPMETKLREGHALADICRKSSFEKVTGERLSEFLEIVTTAMLDEIPPDPRQVPPPGWAGRMVFRQVAAMYGRTDGGPNKGVLSSRSVVGRLLAGFAFARGRGRVPRIHGAIPESATFAQAETPAPLPSDTELLLARYYRIKLESLAFFGTSNFGLTFWDGFDSLLLTFPAIVWLGRLIAAGGTDANEAYVLALRAVDDNFGHSPQLATAKQKWALRMITARGDLPKLIAWYGRGLP